MKFRLIAVGKIREPYVRDAVGDFERRLARLTPTEHVEIAAAHGSDPERAMHDEAQRILALVAPNDTLWLLERTGTELSSIELCERLEALAIAGTGRLTLAVAGTYGAAPALLRRANFQWSLSRLTYLHEWARALVFEQLYRAGKIARGEPYHH